MASFSSYLTFCLQLDSISSNLQRKSIDWFVTFYKWLYYIFFAKLFGGLISFMQLGM